MAKRTEKNFKIRLVKCGEVEPINTEQVIEDFFYSLLKQTKKERQALEEDFCDLLKQVWDERKWQRKQRNKS
jgi:hypothetical protein